MVLTEKPSFAETVEEELTRYGTGAGFGKEKRIPVASRVWYFLCFLYVIGKVTLIISV